MKYFYIAALFAALQVLLLAAVIYLLNRNRKFFAAVIIIFKFAAYVRGVKMLFGFNTAHIIRGVVGYLAGAPISAALFLLAAYLLKRRGKKMQ